MKKLVLLLTIILTFKSFSQIHVGAGQAYATLGDVVAAKIISPGDTIYMHAGTYSTGEWIADSLIGTPSKWITLRAYKNDAVTITAQWTFLKARYFKITGLNWDGTDPSKISHMLFFDYEYNCFTSLRNIIVENCSFTNHNQLSSTSFAMIKFTGTDSFQVTNCIFKNSLNIGDGLSMNGCKNGVVKNCRFENLNCWASHCKGGSDNITYEKNLILNCAAGGIVMGGDTGGPYYCSPGPTYEAKNIHVYSNIISGGAFGIRLASCCYSDVVNNSCYNMSSFAMRVLLESSNSTNFSNNTIANNIIASNDPYGCYINATGGIDYATFYFKNNLFWSYNSTITAPNFEWGGMQNLNVSGSLIGDPKFNNPTANDFSLKSGSPAIGAGIQVSVPATDYNNVPYGSTKRSIGALESASVSVNNLFQEQNAISIYPNPSTGEFSLSLSGTETIKKFDLYDVTGALVYREMSPSNTQKFNLRTLPNGIYKAVVLTSGDQINTQSVVLNR